MDGLVKKRKMKENFEGPRGKAKYKAKIMTPHAERERERERESHQTRRPLSL